MKTLYDVFFEDEQINEESFETQEEAHSFVNAQNHQIFPMDLKIVSRETKTWEDYVEDKYWLYELDRSDVGFGGMGWHSELQECIETNDSQAIYEKIWEWQDDCNVMSYYMNNVRDRMEDDGLLEDYHEHEEEIREWILDHDYSDIVKDLFNITDDVACFYDLGYYLPEYGCDNPEYLAEICNLLGFEDKANPEVLSLMCEAWNGNLRIYFKPEWSELINNGRHDWKEIRFKGNFPVAIIDPCMGGGYYDVIKLDLKLPFMRSNVFVSRAADRYPLEEIFGEYDRWISNHESPEFSEELTVDTKIAESDNHATMEEEKRYIKVFNAGGCTNGDTDIKRHRNVVYKNEPPFCRLECSHCGMEWID